MAEINIEEIIGDAQTMQEAFDKLSKLEMRVGDMRVSTCKILSPRKDFVIVSVSSSSNLDNGMQYLHPYGARIGYRFF